MDIARLYRNRFPDEDRKSKAAIWSVLVRDYLQKFVRPDAIVLDIGCGYGEFLNCLRAGRRIGIDINPDNARFLDAEVEFHPGDVRRLGFLADASVDVVFTSNLLEHMPGKEDVERVLRESWRVLKPAGQFIALGPNLRLLPGEYWDFWDHFTPITDRSLTEVLNNIGFSVEASIPRFLPYTTRSALPQRPWMVSLYLKVPMAWRILGRQFLVRARKGEAASQEDG
jgi:SAM-dependent methyltransferase